jgi:hypothetical protein
MKSLHERAGLPKARTIIDINFFNFNPQFPGFRLFDKNAPAGLYLLIPILQ